MSRVESNLQIRKDEASQLICEVKYKGNFDPVIEWAKDESNESIAINSTLRNESDAYGIRHMILMTNSVNSTLTCKLYFKNFTTYFENMSTNIPAYTDQCNSSVSCGLSSATTITSSSSDGKCN